MPSRYRASADTLSMCEVYARGLPSRVFVCTSSRCPSNNRALEYTNRHSIRAVDRGSYRNLLYSREVARGSDGDGKGERRGEKGKREDGAIRWHTRKGESKRTGDRESVGMNGGGVAGGGGF